MTDIPELERKDVPNIYDAGQDREAVYGKARLLKLQEQLDNAKISADDAHLSCIAAEEERELLRGQLKDECKAREEAERRTIEVIDTNAKACDEWRKRVETAERDAVRKCVQIAEDWESELGETVADKIRAAFPQHFKEEYKCRS